MAKETMLKEIGETLAFIVERMATKDDLKNFATKDDVRAIVRQEISELVPSIVALELKPVREQLKHIEDRLDTLDEQYANLKGVTKEIDDLRREVRTIKKHLGLNTEIAA
jgi:Tfp pilus assembly protein PilO